MPIASVELARPTALVACQRRSRHGRASKGSVAVIAALAVCGIGYVGVMGAILAVSSLFVLCFAATGSRWVHRALDRQSVRRARARREAARQRALGAAPPARHHQYRELRALVEGIERSEPIAARRLELQELLDHFVQLTVGHARGLEALHVAGGGESPEPPSGDPPTTARRRDIAARRLRHREDTTARLGAIADEIDSADDLIRLVAQRAACANLDALLEGEGEVDRRLAELDEVEAALVQVSA